MNEQRYFLTAGGYVLRKGAKNYTQRFKSYDFTYVLCNLEQAVVLTPGEPFDKGGERLGPLFDIVKEI